MEQTRKKKKKHGKFAKITNSCMSFVFFLYFVFGGDVGAYVEVCILGHRRVLYFVVGRFLMGLVQMGSE